MLWTFGTGTLFFVYTKDDDCMMVPSGFFCSSTRCLKKVAHHTLRDIFAQRWPIAEISMATKSEMICEHKFVINVLIFTVLKCCHLAN